MLDADLTGLTVQHIEALVTAYQSEPNIGQVASIRDDLGFCSAAWMRISHFLPLISGERLVKKTLLAAVLEDRLACGFGLEPTLNAFCRHQRLKTKTVFLSGLRQTMKYHKKQSSWWDLGKETMELGRVYTALQFRSLRGSVHQISASRMVSAVTPFWLMRGLSPIGQSVSRVMTLITERLPF